MIQFCLRCPWSECINCLGARNAYGWAVRNWFEYEAGAEPFNNLSKPFDPEEE